MRPPSESKFVPTRNTYRPELDGLRALAIIPVILFHLHPQWLPGGFLGVDVFFVLSGFLITSTILPRMGGGTAKNTFSFWDFYIRRMKRLLPAILTLILVAQCFGSLILFKSEWLSLSAQAVSVIGIVSNFFFWKQTGNYWGASAETMPLLHAWSLSVEEQFYLIYPILLSLVVRLKFRWNALFWFTLVAVMLSSAGFIYARRHFPDAGFFWSIFRAWELLAGCLLAIFGWFSPRSEASTKLLDQWLPLVGISLIIIGYLSGWGISVISYRNAFMTVLGTCLVIQFTGRNSRFVWPMLTLSPLVGIGLVSYSLYLWHWPVIVFSRFACLSSLAFPFLLTGILAYASYRWVEKPLRFCTHQKFFRWFIPLFSVTLLSLLLPLAVKPSGVKYRIPEFSSSINLEPGAVKSWYGSYEGTFRTGLSLFNPEEGPADAVILGDSHSLMFFPAIRQSCEAFGLRLAFFGADGGTSPFLIEEGVPAIDYGRGWTLEERRTFDEARLAFISQANPRFVFVCARWGSYSWTESRLTTHLRRLKEACGSSHLIFLGQPPELPFGSDGFTSGVLEKPVLRPFAEFPNTTDSRARMHEILRRFCAENPESHFVSTEDYYLREGQLYFMDGETLFYKDDDHLSIDGSLRAVPAVDQILRSLQALASNRVSK